MSKYSTRCNIRGGVAAGAVLAAVSLTTAFAHSGMASALPGDDPNCQEQPGKTCTQTPPVSLLCPLGYVPAPQQPATGTLCITVGQDQAGNLHAIARAAPLLCAHVAVGNNARPEDIVRTLHCPVYEPTSPFKNCAEAAAAGYTNIPSTDPHYAAKLDRDHDGIACETPAPEVPPAPVTQTETAAPVPPIQEAHLPVTH